MVLKGASTSDNGSLIGPVVIGVRAESWPIANVGLDETRRTGHSDLSDRQRANTGVIVVDDECWARHDGGKLVCGHVVISVAQQCGRNLVSFRTSSRGSPAGRRAQRLIWDERTALYSRGAAMSLSVALSETV